MSPSPVFCALDIADASEALRMGQAVAPHVGGLKLGLEFFIANGPEGVRQMQRLGLPIFLDLKLHDIPNTVAGAVRAAATLGVEYLTIHASGGSEMMSQAVKAADGRLKLLAVTVLTSLDDADLITVGQRPPAGDQVIRLARLAVECGVPGIVCAPTEIAAVRRVVGEGIDLVVPGIRPGAASDDQKRVMTPAEAMAAGANYLVIGRPITGATDPAGAAKEILAGLRSEA